MGLWANMLGVELVVVMMIILMEMMVKMIGKSEEKENGWEQAEGGNWRKKGKWGGHGQADGAGMASQVTGDGQEERLLGSFGWREEKLGERYKIEG